MLLENEQREVREQSKPRCKVEESRGARKTSSQSARGFLPIFIARVGPSAFAFMPSTDDSFCCLRSLQPPPLQCPFILPAYFASFHTLVYSTAFAKVVSFLSRVCFSWATACIEGRKRKHVGVLCAEQTYDLNRTARVWKHKMN